MADALDPESLLQQLERDTTTRADERGDSFRRLADFYRANDNPDAAERMATLAHVFSGVVAVGRRWSDGDGPRFAARFEWSNGTSSPVFGAMTQARWDCVREFRDQSVNPVHRARLSDFMWEGLKEHETARDAIAAYLAISRQGAAGGGGDWAAADAAVRAVDLSALINDAVSMASAAEICLDLVRLHVGAGSWRPAVSLIRELLASPNPNISRTHDS